MLFVWNMIMLARIWRPSFENHWKSFCPTCMSSWYSLQVCTYDRMGLGFSKRLMQNESTGTEKGWGISTTGRWVSKSSNLNNVNQSISTVNCIWMTRGFIFTVLLRSQAFGQFLLGEAIILTLKQRQHLLVEGFFNAWILEWFNVQRCEKVITAVWLMIFFLLFVFKPILISHTTIPSKYKIQSFENDCFIYEGN